jgi:hypothetical protein
MQEEDANSMSILLPGAVLLLGAGTSAPFSVPLGANLIDETIRMLNDDVQPLARPEVDIFHPGPISNRLMEVIRSDYLPPTVFSDAAGLRTPVRRMIATNVIDRTSGKYLLDGIKPALREIYELREVLSGQTSETIDDFIVENPRWALFVKRCVAARIVAECFQVVRNMEGAEVVRVKPLDGRFMPAARPGRSNQNIRNWVHRLINVVRNGIRSGEFGDRRKVRIISFNYDPILEYVLQRQFSNTERGFPEWSEVFEIAHVHGALPSISDGVFDFEKLVFNGASGIAVVNENANCVPENVKQDREKAREWICTAEKLYVAGFAFGRRNCQLIGLNEGRQRSLAIEALNFDGGEAIKLSAGAEGALAGNTQIRWHNPDPGGTISIEDWFLRGVLGPLPG